MTPEEKLDLFKTRLAERFPNGPPTMADMWRYYRMEQDRLNSLIQEFDQEVGPVERPPMGHVEDAADYAEYLRLKAKFEGWKTAKTAPDRAAMIDHLETAWRPKTDAAEVRA